MKNIQYLLVTMLTLLASVLHAQGSCSSGSMNECCIDLENVTSFRLVAPPIDVCTRKAKNYVSEKILKNESAEVSFMVGSPGLPYYEMATDIENMMSCDCLPFDLKPSEGSNETIDKIISDEDAKFGIVQSDVLRARALGLFGMRRNSIEVEEEIRVVTKLHTEVVHVIVKKDSQIEKWLDLRGKKIHIGAAGSGTNFTARVLLGEWIPKGQESKYKNSIFGFDTELKVDNDGREDLRADVVDAMFQVAGVPTTLLKEDLLASGSEYTLLKIPKLKYLPDGYYDVETLGSSDYSDLNQTSTYAIDALLVTYNWNKAGHWCEQSKKIRDKLTASIDKLKELAAMKPSMAAKSWLGVDTLHGDLVDLQYVTCD